MDNLGCVGFLMKVTSLSSEEHFYLTTIRCDELTNFIYSLMNLQTNSYKSPYNNQNMCTVATQYGLYDQPDLLKSGRTFYQICYIYRVFLYVDLLMSLKY